MCLEESGLLGKMPRCIWRSRSDMFLGKLEFLIFRWVAECIKIQWGRLRKRGTTMGQRVSGGQCLYTEAKTRRVPFWKTCGFLTWRTSSDPKSNQKKTSQNIRSKYALKIYFSFQWHLFLIAKYSEALTTISCHQLRMLLSYKALTTGFISLEGSMNLGFVKANFTFWKQCTQHKALLISSDSNQWFPEKLPSLAANTLLVTWNKKYESLEGGTIICIRRLRGLGSEILSVWM